MTVQIKTDYLVNAIKEWYENAKIDYAVNGHLISINYLPHCDALLVIVDEDGKKYQCDISYISDYTPEQIYNIWMEFGTDEQLNSAIL